MSYTFRVVFDGVCAYVPEKPFFKKNDAGQWEAQHRTAEEQRADGENDELAVLLPDLRRPGRPYLQDERKLNFPTFRASHFPLLAFKLADLREGTTRRVDLVCRDISQKDEDGYLFLRREQIRFDLSAENSKEFSFAGWAPSKVDEDQDVPKLDKVEQVESLWWLPDLTRIVERYDEATQVREEFLPDKYAPFPAELIARVECGGGRLRTFDFNRKVDGEPLVWRFAKPEAEGGTPGTWNRALSNSLALEFFDVRGPVTIELRRLANEVVIEHLVLAPPPGTSKPVMEISISNREPDLLFREEGFSQATLPDLDFQPFYEMLSKADKKFLYELPVPNPSRTSLWGIQEKPCAGTSMVR